MSETADRPALEPASAKARPDYQAVFEACPNPMLLLGVDAPRFTIVAINRAYAGAFNTEPKAVIGRGVFEVFPERPRPDTAVFLAKMRESLERALRAKTTDRMPVLPRAVDGPDGVLHERFWTARHTPILRRDGEVAYILNTIRDVTPRVKERQATEARALLMREVDHRARNALTVVQGIVRLTDAPTVAEFKEVVLGRVEALARAQTSLARRRWEGAFLQDVIEAELAALAFPGAVEVAGPATLLPPELVQTMSMVLHELATNAVKYGALSTAAGHVNISWRITPENHLMMDWLESGGPPVERPQRTGFGSRLIQQLGRQLGGSVVKDWRREGLSVQITAMLSRI